MARIDMDRKKTKLCIVTVSVYYHSRIGYEGDNCEINIDECQYQPSICLNNGVCQNNVDGTFFKCFCPSGGDYFTGQNCEIQKVRDGCDKA